MHKLTIGFAIHSLSGGGAERVISVLTSYFVEHSYDVHLINNIHMPEEYPLNDSVKRHFIGEKVSNFRLIASLQRVFRLRQICKKCDLDVLVAFMGMNEYSVYATLGIKTKNIISIRVTPEKQYNSGFMRIYNKIILSMASGAVFQTESAKNWYPNILQYKSVVICNPISHSFYNVHRHVEKGLLVASGRLTAQKNYPMMIKVISSVVKEHNIKLCIYGKGEDERMLKVLVNKMNLAENVHFCGYSTDMASVLSRAEIYLLTSDYEGLPNSLMEAMAVGLPCIATDSLGGGTKFLLGNNERGLLSPVKDNKHFAESLIKLLNDENLKIRLSKAAKEYAMQFSFDKCCKIWEKYVCEVNNR